MNNRVDIELANELSRLIDKPKFQKSKDDLLRIASIYRKLSYDLSSVNSSEVRHQIEIPLLKAHRFFNKSSLSFGQIITYLFRILPVTVFRSGYVRLCVLLFYGLFFASMAGGYLSRGYAVSILGEATLQEYEQMHKSEDRQFSTAMGFVGSGYYIVNNMTLDIITYATGLLAGIGSLFYTVYNAVFLGATIGHLLQSSSRDAILSWIFGHAPFELTAIGMAAGAGLQTGLAFLNPKNRSRLSAMAIEAGRALPSIIAALLLTFAAAFIEGFIAPLSLPVYYKITIGVICSFFMVAYFVIPSMGRSAANQHFDVDYDGKGDGIGL